MSISFAGLFVANNTLVAKTAVNAGQSVNTKEVVNKIGPPNVFVL